MQESDKKTTWEMYVEKELASVTPHLRDMGFELDGHQPHLIGERYLSRVRDVGGGGYKLVLFGTDKNTGMRVVIKATSDPDAIAEIQREHICRTALETINFAYRPFAAPRELASEHRDRFFIFVTEYIAQEKPFVERPLEEQFSLALHAFKLQEGLHATTYSHERRIRATFGSVSAKDYERSFAAFIDEIQGRLRTTISLELARALSESVHLLSVSQTSLERYGNFLTHADFSPQNFRIKDGTLYLLDYASLHFGNKYESWGRFLNFMALYNPELERLLTEYIQANRTEEELLCLRLMRAYKLGFLISFYAQATRESGGVGTLAQKRVAFWTQILEAVLAEKYAHPAVITNYKRERDALRSDAEKVRQKDLH